MRTIDILTNRIRAEYLEMPGLRLTPEQVQRLCGIERMICQLLLNELVDVKFPCVKVDRRYARPTEGVNRAKNLRDLLDRCGGYLRNGGCDVEMGSTETGRRPAGLL